ncbi:MAG TPA: hypothetical protein VJ577_08585 [Burkholderiaceae bacterium]|nr:hypothetical protein [Burkholderiaceae bacterium]
MDTQKVVRIKKGTDGTISYHLQTVAGQRLHMLQSSQDSWAVILIGDDGTPEKAWTSALEPAVESTAHFVLAVLEEEYGEMTAEYLKTLLEFKKDIQRKYFKMTIGCVVVHTRRALARSPQDNEVVIQICETGEIRRYFSRVGHKIEFSYDVLDMLPF